MRIFLILRYDIGKSPVLLKEFKMQFNCPHCNANVSIEGVKPNTQIQCGVCQKLFSTPATPPSITPPAPFSPPSTAPSFQSSLPGSKRRTPTRSEPTGGKRPSSLRWIPAAFYIIAVLASIAYLVIIIRAADNGVPGAIIINLVGIGIGLVLAVLASGRTIELLQNISDSLYSRRQ